MVSLEIYSGSEQFKFTPYFSHFARSNPVISYFLLVTTCQSLVCKKRCRETKVTVKEEQEEKE